ncbi:MAG: phytoene desaturase family protein [Acetobacterium sp.]
MKNLKVYDVIVVGGGIAGLTSAAYVTKAGYSTLLCEKGRKPGGLVSTFTKNGFTFDAGIRAFENSGIIFPMLKQLGIEMSFVHNPVSIGIEDDILKLQGKKSLSDYRDMLCRKFPENNHEIEKIIGETKKVIQYMDVIYGIDNPLFMDLTNDKEYLIKTLLPWLLKYQVNIRKAEKLNLPINRYLLNFTKNQALIDMITQHLFQNMPTFFALSYFGLYDDYSYPIGGTGVLVDKMISFIRSNQGEIAINTEIACIDSENKWVKTNDDRLFRYRELIWCADMKSLYAAVDIKSAAKQELKTQKKIAKQKKQVMENHGCDSILSIYMSVNLDKPYFEDISGGHLFYTPSKAGLSSIHSKNWKYVISEVQMSHENKKTALKEWIGEYLSLTTYELSCPSLRDATLAPEGMTGVIASTLMDYNLVKYINEAGWYDEYKSFCKEQIISVLDQTIFPEFEENIQDAICSTPLTIERLTGNAEGAITGWAFADHQLPGVNEFRKIAKSVITPIPHIHQAGQWTFSPSGLPISILTGKLAGDAVCKKIDKDIRLSGKVSIKV